MVLKELNDQKVGVSMTLDVKLLKELNDYKWKNRIQKISPLINAILWKFIKENKKTKPKKADTPIGVSGRKK